MLKYRDTKTDLLNTIERFGSSATKNEGERSKVRRYTLCTHTLKVWNTFLKAHKV